MSALLSPRAHQLLLLAALALLLLVTAAPPAQAQLADSPWPMFRHDLQHTGRSPYTRPASPAIQWVFTTGSYVESSPAVGADGTLYVGAHDDHLGVMVEALPSVSDLAYLLLTQRVTANHTSFYVYQDADSGFNHGFASGWFGTVSKIDLDIGCVSDPNAPNGCAAPQDNPLDQERGTLMRVSFDPLLPGEYAGINIEEPENWGATGQGIGYGLSGALAVVLDVRSPGGIRVRFGVGGCPTAFIDIPQSWATLTIPLDSLACTPDLSNVHLLFSIVTNVTNAPDGGTVLLDNIRFEPVPTRQEGAPSLPVGSQTFGVVPLSAPDPGRVPFPPDQVSRNMATTYESALTLLALLARGTPEDLHNAQFIADTFHYALHHDNHGDPLPVAQDGSTGLHSAYMSGDIASLNDQPGGALAADVRLAGFTAPQRCPQSGFCLVLDGATGGDNAFAILALAAAYRQFGEQDYLDDARTIGRWIDSNLRDGTGTGYGGYYLGYPHEGQIPKVLITAKSVENNADISAAFTVLATIERELGNSTAAEDWTTRANVAGDFVMQMFNPQTGCFYAGTVPVGTQPGDGVDPTGPQMGNDVINVFGFLDANTFTTLALAADPRYRDQIDWRLPVQCLLDRFHQSITVGEQQFLGFNIIELPIVGPKGVAWEFTGQAVVAMRSVDRLYQESRFEGDADFYLTQILKAQALAPFGDGLGLVASTLQGGDLLPPIEQCLSTPFQCIPERVSLASTTWAIFADQGFNPLASLPVAATDLRTGVDTDNAAGLALAILQVVDPQIGQPLPGLLIGSYQATFQYNGALLQVLDVRHKAPFADNATTINNPGGNTLFSGIAPGGAAWPVQSAFVTLRLTGCATDAVTLTPTMNLIQDSVGNALQMDQPAPKTFRRGDAKPDGTVDMADALFIAQRVVGLREVGEDPETQVNAVNAASVKHDGAFDLISAADVLRIAQRAVGQRDNCFNLLPAAIPPRR